MMEEAVSSKQLKRDSRSQDIILSEKENEVYSENSILKINLEKCIEEGLCTYQITGDSGWVQKYYNCEECNKIGDNGFCETCMEYCHSGHKGVHENTNSPTYFHCTCEHCLCKEKEFHPDEPIIDLHETPQIDPNFCGNGKYYFKNGACYIGDFKNGKMEGNGVIFGKTNSSCVRYEGEFKNGKKSGKGMLLQSIRGIFTRYEGEVENDDLNGIGKLFKSAVGILVYEGEFKDGKFDGHGTRYYEDGFQYVGEWRNGLREGRGRCTFPNGMRYEGEYVNDEKEGKGLIFYDDGTVCYGGDFKNGKKHGIGEWRKKGTEGKERYQGEFKAGEFSGRGEMCFEDGKSCFVGMFRNGQRDGRGKYTTRDGTIHEGQWKRGKKHGVMIVTDPNMVGTEYLNNQRLEAFFMGEGANYRIFKLIGEIGQVFAKKLTLEYSLESGNTAHRNDKEFVLSVLKYRGKDLKFASDNLKMDIDVVRSAIKNHAPALSHAHEMFRMDKALVEEVVQLNPMCLLYVNKKHLNDPVILSTAMTRNGLMLKYVSRDVQEKYRSVVIDAVKQNGLALKYCSSYLLDGIIRKKNNLLSSGDQKFYDNLILMAVNENPNSIRYYSSRNHSLEFNREVVKRATRKFKESISSSHFFEIDEETDNNHNIIGEQNNIVITSIKGENTKKFSSIHSLLNSSSEEFERIIPKLRDFSEGLLCSQCSWRKWADKGIEQKYLSQNVYEGDLTKLKEQIAAQVKETFIPEIFFEILFCDIITTMTEQVNDKNEELEGEGEDEESDLKILEDEIFDDEDKHSRNNEIEEDLKKMRMKIRTEMENVVDEVFDIHNIGNYVVFLGFVFPDFIRRNEQLEQGQGEGQQDNNTPIISKLTTQERKEYREGFGIVFYQNSYKVSLFGKQYYAIEIGNFVDGKKEGKGKIFNKKTGVMSFEGKFSFDKRHGSGREYTQSFGKFNVVHFEGLYQEDRKHGRGELYDLKTGKVKKGVWENNKLDPKSIFTFNCPIINYDKIKNHLKNSVIVGSGAFGIVYKVKASSIPSIGIRKGNVAVKIMKCDSSYHVEMLFRMTKRGIGLCCSLNSPHILAVYGIIRGIREVGYVMQICHTGVDRLIENENLTIEDKTSLLFGTAKGMKDLHEKCVMHRDLKWANVMVRGEKKKDWVVKITDFDTLKEDERSWRLQSCPGSSRIGTPGFLAPEVFLGKEYTLACDVYAFGLMIHSLLFENQLPISTQYQCSCGNLVENILLSNSLDYHVANCSLRPLLIKSELSKYPEFLIDLMTSCWERDPQKRLSFDEIVQVFEGGMKQEKCYCVIILHFPKFRRILSDQKMLLVQPKLKKIVDWVETKMKGSKVLSLTNKLTGQRLENDVQVLDLMNLSSVNKNITNPVIGVDLDRVDESKVGSLNLLKRTRKGGLGLGHNNKIGRYEMLLEKENLKLKKENEVVKKENLGCKTDIDLLKKENQMLKKKIQILIQKAKSRSIKLSGTGSFRLMDKTDSGSISKEEIEKGKI